MSYFLQRIQLYEKILLSAFTDNESVGSLGVKISELSKQTSDLSGDLEIAIRNVSLNLHSNSQDVSGFLDQDFIIILLSSFCLEIKSKYNHRSNKLYQIYFKFCFRKFFHFTKSSQNTFYLD